MPTISVFSFNRITFGLLCLALAALLLLGLGVRRLRLWLRHRKRPDLRQRGAGSPYSGGHKRRPSGDLPYSGLSSYKGSRRHRPGGARPLFQPPSYKGRKR